ncbi:hypothetical protein EAF00_011784 [Botryotinia globosa]|nr:hypothetical protein EAF00_011784 [Botryotinia globosa]
MACQECKEVGMDRDSSVLDHNTFGLSKALERLWWCGGWELCMIGVKARGDLEQGLVGAELISLAVVCGRRVVFL